MSEPKPLSKELTFGGLRQNIHEARRVCTSIELNWAIGGWATANGSNPFRFLKRSPTQTRLPHGYWRSNTVIRTK